MATLIRTEVDGVYEHRSKNNVSTFYGRDGRNLQRLGSTTEGMNLAGAAEKQLKVKGTALRKKNGIPTLNEVFASFAGTVARQVASTKNHIDYMARYELHIRKKFGHMGLNEITATMMKDLHTEICGKKSEAQAYHILNVIRFLYSHAVSDNTFHGRKPFGKAVGFSLTVPRKRREAIYSTDEVNSILDKLKLADETTYYMAMTSFLTGMRFGEVCGIQEMHVDLKRSMVKLVDTKSGYDRVLPLPDAVLEIFASRMTGVAANYIFKNSEDNRVKYLSKKFAKVLDDLGINNGVTDSRFQRKFHTLRHSYATLMLDNKAIELKELQAMLGHENITTTQRYIHANSEAMRSAAKSAGSLLARR
jgi:integrase